MSTIPSVHDIDRANFRRLHAEGSLTDSDLRRCLDNVTELEAADTAWAENRADCPTWCEEHPSADFHVARIVVGGMSVEICSVESGDPKDLVPSITPPDVSELMGGDVRDLIAALTQAADIVDGAR